MKSNRLVLPVILVSVFSLMTALRDATAFPRYNDGCQKCHGAFTNDFSAKPGNTWPGTKHDVHRYDMLDGVCDACHLDGDQRNPYINMSNGTADLPGVGCLGCHGRYYGSEGTTLGAGLRAHHHNVGMTFCVTCHPNDPSPLAESILPEYYGRPTVNITHPCNLNGSEDWTPNDLGLDNDGDLVYDGDDRDCFGPPRTRDPLQR